MPENAVDWPESLSDLLPSFKKDANVRMEAQGGKGNAVSVQVGFVANVAPSGDQLRALESLKGHWVRFRLPKERAARIGMLSVRESRVGALTHEVFIGGGHPESPR